MNYNFINVRKQKIVNLTEEGKVLKNQTPIVASHFATAIFDQTLEILSKNETTDRFYDSNNPKIDTYEVSFKNPSQLFLSALTKTESQLNTKTVFRNWITTDVEISSTIASNSNEVVVISKKEFSDDETANHLWRKNWKNLLCSKIVDELNKKFDNVEQAFFCDVVARGGRKMGKISSSLSYDSGNFNKVIVKIGDNENDPTQDIFDSLFHSDSHQNNNFGHSGNKGFFSFFSK